MHFFIEILNPFKTAVSSYKSENNEEICDFDEHVCLDVLLKRIHECQM